MGGHLEVVGLTLGSLSSVLHEAAAEVSPV